MNFEEELAKRAQRIEGMVLGFLPEPAGEQRQVLEAMRYAVSVGGKRLRPLLMAESAALFAGEEAAWQWEAREQALLTRALPPLMAAIEFIHTYSLIHDDLPALDNDAYRRGQKTTHLVYGEDIAVIAGDGLLNYAYETAFRAFLGAASVEDYQRVECALNILGRKAGVYGMVGGQCADLLAERPGVRVTGETLRFIHQHKTAALIQAAMIIGAALAGAEEQAVVQLSRCAENIGVAFQIQDDILDVTGSEKTLGKPVGSDEKNHKPTYVTVYGLEESGRLVEELSREAIGILRSFPQRNLFLEELTGRLIHRER